MVKITKTLGDVRRATPLAPINTGTVSLPTDTGIGALAGSISKVANEFERK